MLQYGLQYGYCVANRQTTAALAGNKDDIALDEFIINYRIASLQFVISIQRQAILCRHAISSEKGWMLADWRQTHIERMYEHVERGAYRHFYVLVLEFYNEVKLPLNKT